MSGWAEEEEGTDDDVTVAYSCGGTDADGDDDEDEDEDERTMAVNGTESTAACALVRDVEERDCLAVAAALTVAAETIEADRAASICTSDDDKIDAGCPQLQCKYDTGTQP